MTDRFYITTPIYYVNDVPHLGTAYTTVAADVLARFHRLLGDDTFFLTGTDEHGLKLERLAKEKGMTPKAFADQMSQPFRAAWPELSCRYDHFVRTTDPDHEAGVAEIWKRIESNGNGDLVEGEYEGWYCVPCEAYYTEKELEPGNLCPMHKRSVEKIREPTFFFKLSKYGPRLLEFYANNPDFVAPASRMNEVTSFVRGGLEDLSVSRTTFDWGVRVPGHPTHVMYVWLDALFSYYTPIRGASAPAARRDLWPPAVHLMGKDILRFHAVYWPAFLWAAGFEDKDLPQQIFAHGFLTFNGMKMSKTLRNTVSPLTVAKAFGALRGMQSDPDPLRYYLMRAIAFGQDGDVSMKDMVTRYNTELGNGLGNLLNRTLGLCLQHTESRVPERSPHASVDAQQIDHPFHKQIADVSALTKKELSELAPHRALDALWTGVAAANQYIDKAAPWAAAKKGEGARVKTILRNALDALTVLSTMLWPVMPGTADAIRAQLGLGPIVPPPQGTDRWPSGDEVLRDSGLTTGQALQKGSPVFPRIDADREAQLVADIGLDRLGEKLAAAGEVAAPVAVASASSGRVPAGGVAPTATGAAPSATPAASPPATISFDDFAKVDLRVGVVVAAERVKGKDKLLSLKVDLGEAEPRSIVAGIALSFTPEQVVGRRVAVVANLEPRKFGGGLVSHGMLLACGPSETLELASPGDRAPPGSRVK